MPMLTGTLSMVNLQLAGMAVGCTLLFGADSYQFHSPSWSAFTLFRATFGDIDYTDWMSNRFPPLP
jgi:hypothetical protein